MQNEVFTYHYRSAGSLALKPTVKRFVVLDGGKESSAIETASSRNKSTNDQIEAFSVYSLMPLVLIVVSLAFIASIWIFSAISQQERVESILSRTELSTVTIQQGDTVWSLAKANPVDGLSTSELVSQINKINHLTSKPLQIGEQIKIPTE